MKENPDASEETVLREFVGNIMSLKYQLHNYYHKNL